jgi:hypothetical protein
VKHLFAQLIPAVARITSRRWRIVSKAPEEPIFRDAKLEPRSDTAGAALDARPRRD